ncbi:hypothetical protein BJV74DRAFT_539491 [Russula compacta]|nr:hypothetical protein BJV74DRAFT_539491 [Russula compacta]
MKQITSYKQTSLTWSLLRSPECSFPWNLNYKQLNIRASAVRVRLVPIYKSLYDHLLPAASLNLTVHFCCLYDQLNSAACIGSTDRRLHRGLMPLRSLHLNCCHSVSSSQACGNVVYRITRDVVLELILPDSTKSNVSHVQLVLDSSYNKLFEL